MNIKNIIIDAYRTASITTQGMSPDADESNIALGELNEILNNYNLDNYLPFTRNTNTFNITESKNEYTIGLSGCDITAETPILVAKVYYKTANDATYSELRRVRYEDIFGFKSVQNSSGTPVIFSYDRTWPNGRLVFDINPQAGGIVTFIYNKKIPEVLLDDVIDIPPEYNELFKNTLAVALMKINKMDPNSIAMIESNVKNILYKISKRNQVDKIITYNDDYNSGPLANYYNLFCPKGW
jgi:hypothetical protein